jgi:hypothetical protein
MTGQEDTTRSGVEGTYLEKVIDDEAMLTCEKTETSPEEKALNAMSHSSHPCKLRSVPSNPSLRLISNTHRMQVAVAYMIDGPSYTGQSMLNSFIFDSAPQSASPYTCGALLRIDDCVVEITREVDYKAVFGRRGTRGAMASAADRNLKVIRPSVLQRERNVVGVLHEGDDTSRALRIGGPPGNGLGISVIIRGHDIPFERLLEGGETRHPR